MCPETVDEEEGRCPAFTGLDIERRCNQLSQGSVLGEGWGHAIILSLCDSCAILLQDIPCRIVRNGTITMEVSLTEGRRGVRPEGGSASSKRGFSLLEMAVALVVVAVITGLSVLSFGEYSRRTAARRAAEVFGRDLAVARATAVAERTPVAVVFDEAAGSYLIRTAGGDVLVSRNFGSGGEIPLSSIDLEVDADSVIFSERGILDFTGIPGSLAAALFQAGDRTYRVSFNATGMAEVEGL
jgi:prepilin-type N-terminal cleavage/methylation domain-containing protein